MGVNWLVSPLDVDNSAKEDYPWQCHLEGLLDFVSWLSLTKTMIPLNHSIVQSCRPGLMLCRVQKAVVARWKLFCARDCPIVALHG